MTSKILWCDETWNPVTGCSPISPGCEHCYAARMANRLRGRCGYPRKNPFVVTIHEDKLIQPILWKKPRRIFVCSMGDLFHPDVPAEWVNKVLGHMAEAPQHKYMILTKRPDRLLVLYEQRLLPNWSVELIKLGVTVETQDQDWRMRSILDIPAAGYFVSVEPCLGQIDLMLGLRGRDVPHIEEVFLGGETGPGARPMHPDWARSIRDQCVRTNTPFLFKGWGEWAPRRQNACYSNPEPGSLKEWTIASSSDKKSRGKTIYHAIPSAVIRDEKGFFDYEVMERVGKKSAGRLLDGRTWDGE